VVQTSCLAQAIDAYWDLHEKFVKNTSDKMLEMATTDTDDLYSSERAIL